MVVERRMYRLHTLLELLEKELDQPQSKVELHTKDQLQSKNQLQTEVQLLRSTPAWEFIGKPGRGGKQRAQGGRSFSQEFTLATNDDIPAESF